MCVMVPSKNGTVTQRKALLPCIGPVFVRRNGRIWLVDRAIVEATVLYSRVLLPTMIGISISENKDISTLVY